MTLTAQPLAFARAPIVDVKTGMITPDFHRYLMLLEQRTGPALNIRGVLEDSFRLNPVDAQYTVKSGLALSQVGVSTVISLSSGVMKYSAGELSIGASTVDPGGYGLYVCYIDNPLYQSATFALQASLNFYDAVAQKGRIYLGSLTTAGGGGGAGGGSSNPPAGGGSLS